MRHLSISTRLTLALSVSGLMLLGAGGLWQLSAEESDLRKAAARELRLLGRSLQVAFENALRDRQSEDVEETLRELERIDPTVDIFVFDPFGRQIAASTGAIAPPWPEDREAAMGLRFHEQTSRPSAELRLPLTMPGNRSDATLVLVQPLRGMYADLSATRQRVALSTLGFLLIVVSVVAVVTRVWVKTPLSRMVDHMRRVRSGDLTTSPRGERRRDEIGSTLDEFDALVRDLAEARQRLETEGETRRGLELALREVDKLATVGQLAAGLAHEIGSPLQILAGRIAGLEAKANDPDETRRLARILREQTQRITRIVSRLSDLARRRTAAPRWMDPGPPIRAVAELLRGEATRRGVSLTVDIGEGLPSVRGDPDSIQQLSLNLLRNALDATPDGGSIHVAMRPLRREREENDALHLVRLRVADTGCGMSEEERDRAFEPFFTTRADDGGSGLGLAVVKSLVDDLDGRISIETKLGEGTAFTVDLPAEPSGDGRSRSATEGSHGA